MGLITVTGKSLNPTSEQRIIAKIDDVDWAKFVYSTTCVAELRRSALDTSIPRHVSICWKANLRHIRVNHSTWAYVYKH